MTRAIQEAVVEYFQVQYTDKEREVIQARIKKIEADFAKRKQEVKMDAVQQLIFINLIGYPTAWADFSVLEVMALDSYSAKRICYTAAAQLWSESSDVVLMATNRVQKDLVSSKPLIASLVLSSLPPYLTPMLAQHVSNDVIKLMTSSKDYVKQRAIMTFYHVCLHWPDALKPGFPTLRGLLDDSNPGVVLSALTVLYELCLTNPQNFVQMIPKFFKMLEKNASNWISIKLIQILTILTSVETRLVKRLVEPYSNIMQNGTALTVVYQVARSIIDIPITNSSLIQIALNRMDKYVNSADPVIQNLFTALFLKMLKLQPKLSNTYRDLVTNCLDSEDESLRLVSLELLGSMANVKNLDKVVDRMFEHFKTAITVKFRNQIITTVIELCSQNDYEYISDFDWYIDVLMDFINEGAFTCYDILSDQFLDLAVRVPSTREKVTHEMAKLFETSYTYKDAVPLMLAAAHIIGEFASSSVIIEKIMNDKSLKCSERVQQAFLTSAMRYYIRAETKPKKFIDQITQFKNSTFVDIQNEAHTYSMLTSILASEEGAASSVRAFMEEQEAMDCEIVPIAFPEDFNDPNPLFEDLVESETICIQKTAKKKRTLKKIIRRQKEQSSEKIVIKKASKRVDTVSKAPGVLSEGLAAVSLDLDAQSTETVTPVKPSNRTRKQKKAPAGKKRAESDDKPKYLQLIAETPVLRITLESVQSEEKQLTMTMALENVSSDVIPSIDMSMTSTATVKTVDVIGYYEPLEPKAVVKHTIDIECENPAVPQIARIMISPISCGAESFEVKVRIFPSYFLTPCEPNDCDSEQCTNEITATVNMPPQKCAQTLSKMLRCKMVPNKETKVIMMYAETGYGAQVIASLSAENSAANITINSNDATLLDSLINEIQMTLK